MIKTRVLGNSGLEVSEIAFGGMSLGQDHQENEKIIHQAIDLGINFFDTADLYDQGFNEETIGKALFNKRKEVFISSKVGNVLNPDGKTWHWGPNKAYMLKAVEDSLRRLQTDYLDLYQLHGGTIEDPIDEIIEAFELLKESGKIRAYGISSIRPNVIREYIQRSNISSVMSQYSALDRRPEESVLGALQESGIGVLSRGGLARGILVNKPAKPYLSYSEEQVAELKKRWSQHGDPLKASLQFVLQHDAITTAVLGIRSVDQLQGIVKAYQELKPIKELFLLPPNTYENHR
ncbi:MAG: aldo/keto reductase [Cytophagales bacterium]|nr:aldo/keto reductase [Cytophagales bacterium]